MRPRSSAILCLVLLLIAIFAAAADPGRGVAEQGCVGELLRPPTTGELGSYVVNPGNSPYTSGEHDHQLIEVHVAYAAVAGCQAYGRSSHARVEIRRRGEAWRIPSARLRYGFDITQGLNPGKSREAFEGGFELPGYPELLATCKDRARPQFRVAVRTAVKRLQTRKTVATSPFTYLPVAYEPPPAAGGPHKKVPGCR